MVSRVPVQATSRVSRQILSPFTMREFSSCVVPIFWALSDAGSVSPGLTSTSQLK